MKQQPVKRKIKYRAHMSVGSMAAETDGKFLSVCFVETGDYEVIQDLRSPKCILLGRTGTGKSASIIKLNQKYRNVINIDPQSLALNYISNSDILRFFSTLGVNLDIFYKLLWQHVLCVELLNHHFKMKSENEAGRFREWISTLVKRDKSTELAAQYLQKWNAKFWLEREERIKEITKTLEENMFAEAGLEQYGIKARVGSAQGISQEIKSEIVHKAQKVVNDIQIQHLSQMVDILAKELYDDDQKKTFITIDGLDEEWVEDELRYKLIRALIEAIKKFRRIQNVKIVVALRSDLLHRVYKYTRDSGFQEEKYEDLNLRISWKKEHLKLILDERINFLFKDQYTTENLTFGDIFPEKIKNEQSTFDFIVQRTLMRPRDIIAFVNNVLERAEGLEIITAKMILDSERTYSEKRLQAVLQEWVVEYPRLGQCLFILKNKSTSFSCTDFSKKDLEDLLCLLTLTAPRTKDLLEEKAHYQMDSCIDLASFRSEFLEILFRVGIIGYKESPSHPFIFSYNSHISEPQFNDHTKIQIHPMFWAALGNKKLKGGVMDAVND